MLLDDGALPPVHEAVVPITTPMATANNPVDRLIRILNPFSDLRVTYGSQNFLKRMLPLVFIWQHFRERDQPRGKPVCALLGTEYQRDV